MIKLLIFIHVLGIIGCASPALKSTAGNPDKNVRQLTPQSHSIKNDAMGNARHTDVLASHQKPPVRYAYDYGTPLAPLFHSIKIDDKINAREADVLATLYFLRYDGFCGANSPVFQKSRFWHASTTSGPSGSSDNDILINSTSGVVSQKGNPDSYPPWDDLRDVLIQPAYKDRVDGTN